MIEPVELKDFFITFFSAALVILSGAGYAGLYAWAKLRGMSTPDGQGMQYRHSVQSIRVSPR